MGKKKNNIDWYSISCVTQFGVQFGSASRTSSCEYIATKRRSFARTDICGKHNRGPER